MKKRIFIAICTVILIFLLGGTYIIISNEVASSKLDNLIELHQVEMLRHKLLFHIDKVQSDLSLINTSHAVSEDTAVANAKDLRNKSNKCLECHHQEDVKDRLDYLNEEIDSYGESLKTFLAVRAGGANAEKEFDVAFHKLNDLSDLVNDMVHMASTSLYAETESSLRHIFYFKIILYALVIITPFFVAGLGFIFIRNITKPVEALLKATRKLKAGDLDYKMDDLKDEFGEVAGSFNEMSASLNEMMYRIEESQKRYRILFESAGDGIFILETEEGKAGDILSANQAAADMHGYTIDEILELNIGDLDSPGAPSQIPERMRRIMAGEWIKAEIDHVKKDGSVFPVEISAGLLEFENHKYILAFDRDITTRKQAGRAIQELENKKILEEELRKERNQLQLILDSLPDGIIVVDGDNNLELANTRFEEMIGLDPRSLVKDGEFRDHFRVRTEWADEPVSDSPISQVRKTGEPVQFIHLKSANGADEEYFRIIITPFFDKERNLRRIVETVRPITEIIQQRRLIDESEDRFRRFIENARDMITIKDVQGRYQVINKSAASLFGLTPMDYIGRTDNEILPKELADILTRKDQEVLERKEYLEDKATLNVGGRIRYLDIVHFPLFDYKGDVTGICSISRDATEEYQLQKMLIESEKMAAVGKLAASVAHEINNPLTGILSFAEELKMDTMEKDKNNPIIHDYDTIIREAVRCREIVLRLLDYARVEQSRRQSMNINTAIEHSIRLVSKQVLFQDVEFDIDLADDLPEVSCDPMQMQQVFLNLIINAGEAINGAGKISLSSRLSDDGRFVEGQVTDSGPGVSPDVVDRIFEPFFSTKGSKGTGQGLSIVKAIIDQQGGSIEVNSQIEPGASFKVSVPVPRP
ncbi:MAG: PAS domain S-box protein [Candidatus Adiutricales bacterium]